jgi:hypothetical protein
VKLVLVALLLLACDGAPSRTLPNGSPVAVVDQACADRIRPLYDAMSDLNSRLNVGLSKQDYATRVGDIQVVYDRMVAGGPFGPGACVQTAQKLETAGTEYIQAHTKWNDCLTNTACSNDSIRPTLQGHWATASRLLTEVQYALP